MQLPTSLYQTCKFKKVNVRVGYENHTRPRWPPVPRLRYEDHRGGMSILTLGEVQQEGVCGEAQGLGLQVLHVHVRGEGGVIHDREPLVPVGSNESPVCARTWEPIARLPSTSVWR